MTQEEQIMMEQFNLEIWLQDKSRKVVTRRGNPVRIICTDRKHGEDTLPIVFLEESNGGEFLLTCKSNGRIDNYDTQYDLFFADEEELTEFQNKLFSIISEIWQNYLLGREIDIAETVKEYSGELLDLARMELENELEKEFYRGFSIGQNSNEIIKAYKQGKENALKDLPKWKKATEHKDFETNNACVLDDDIYPIVATNVNIGEYYIELDELKNLPIEE